MEKPPPVLSTGANSLWAWVELNHRPHAYQSLKAKLKFTLRSTLRPHARRKFSRKWPKMFPKPGTRPGTHETGM